MNPFQKWSHTLNKKLFILEALKALHKLAPLVEYEHQSPVCYNTTQDSRTRIEGEHSNQIKLDNLALLNQLCEMIIKKVPHSEINDKIAKKNTVLCHMPP